MHALQQHILSRLIFQGECRYRDLKPKAVDGNLFTYHLKQLFEEGLVEKRERSYALTSDGLRYAGTLSLKSFRPRIQPKIVTMIACQNSNNEWLLYHARRQPFRRLTSFPYGKIHLGETIQEAAKRELQEKTEIEAELTHRGDAYITIYQGHDLITHMFCHIFVGTHPTGEPTLETSVGKCGWEKINFSRKSQYTPWFFDLYELINTPTKERFFAELTYKLARTGLTDES